MNTKPEENSDITAAELNSVVDEVIAEAHINPGMMLPEELDYIREHVLKKPLRVVHIWGLGVGSVIAGMFFGWNYGLPVAGPVGMLIASLIVCGLYLTWVLGLSELSVAMPFAGGPMAYGRRAMGKGLGFFMGWSMFLESLFATIGTALAAGGYVAFLLNPEHPQRLTTTIAAIVCSLVFLAIQYAGVKAQATLTLILTWAAIVALIWFWIAAALGISLSRIFTHPLLPGGWLGTLSAVPFALWWLVIIEAVALASEEAHEPHISIPRGMVLAQVTLVALVVLTWFFVCASAPYRETGAVDYPLPLAFKAVWGAGWPLGAFSILSLSGLIVSFNGMLYATSRQSFSLGRAGYLPRVLGKVHPKHRVPHVSLIVWTLVTILFILFGQFYEKATAIAILISTLAAVIWYVLAMLCLFLLRRKEARLMRPYQTPAFPWLPAFVAIVAAFAGYLYGWVNVGVLGPTAVLYAAAGLWYWLWGRHHVLATAPEEVATRIAEKLRQAGGKVEQPLFATPQAKSLDHVTGFVLMTGLLSLLWMAMRAAHWVSAPIAATEVWIVTAVWIALFVWVSWVGYQSTRKPN